MANGKTQKQPKVKRYHLPGKEREYLTANLALLLKAAVPISSALSSLAETGKSRPFKKALAQMQHDIDNGLPLWQTLERSGVAQAQTLTLVRLGEESGNLVENMAIAAQQEEKQRMFRAKVRSAMLYPSFVLGLTAVIGLGVAWFLLPRLSDTFGSLGVELPAISQVVISFGTFLKDNGIWAVPSFFGGIIVLVSILFAVPFTRNLGRRLVFHIPGLKKLMHEVEVARFGYLLGTLLQAGLPVTKALALLHDASTAPRYRAFYYTLQQAFENGFSLKHSFAEHRREARALMPVAVQQMVISAEASGALPDTLQSIGKTYTEKADVSTKNLETVLEPILLLFVWAGVIIVAVAVILPIYSLLGGLDA